jgi:predicted nuclease of restriction endonuclease-like RecB superfamily
LPPIDLWDPRIALFRAPASFGVTAIELENALFADLGGEQRVAELPNSVTPSQLALDANIAIVSFAR